jgi:hypothetical protein
LCGSGLIVDKNSPSPVHRPAFRQARYPRYQGGRRRDLSREPAQEGLGHAFQFQQLSQATKCAHVRVSQGNSDNFLSDPGIAGQSAVFRTKWQIAADQVEACLADGVRFSWITCDEEFTSVPEFIYRMDRSGQRVIGDGP